MSNILAHKSIRIKKNTRATYPTKDGEVRLIDELYLREQQWKHIVKSLLHYYSGLSAIETSTAKSTHALTEVIQVPFHEGHAFMGDGGWQEVLYNVRDKTKLLADHHTNFAHTIDNTVVKELQGVRSELKAHIAAIEKEGVALADEVDKERALSTMHLTTLQQGIDTFENSSEHMLPQHDPYITHHQVATQLAKQVQKENELQAAVIRFQQQQPAFEAGIVKSIQSACRLYDQAQARNAQEIAALQAGISADLQRITPDAEYIFHAAREGAILDPNTPYRELNAVTFPGHNHAASVPIKEGHIERKKRFTKSYKESYYVLTASGYLHERKSNDDINGIKPMFSLFLPECTLGPPAKATDKSHKFHIEGNKAVKSTFESKMKTSLHFGGKEIAYTFRARTHAEMLVWWEQMDKLSRDTKLPVAVTAVKPAVSPVAAAVANVGLAVPVVHATPAPVTASHVATSPATESVHVASSTATIVPGPAPVTHSNVAVSPGHVAHPATQYEKSLHSAGTPSAATVVAPVVTPGAVHDEEEYDSDEEGGSSAEEEESRTAPTTPVPVGMSLSPLDEAGEKVRSTAAEALPTYTGDGTTVAEKEALSEKKPGLFNSIFGGGSPAKEGSTSNPN